MEEKLWLTNLDSIFKKQRHYFATKDPSSESYGFSSTPVLVWELYHKEGWSPKNWCFWTVVSEKPLESLLDCKEIKPVNAKGNQPWIIIGRTNAEALILWLPHAKSWLTGKDPDAAKNWRQEEKGWQRRRSLDGITNSMGMNLSKLWEMVDSLACCSPWCCKETVLSDWIKTTKLNLKG